MKKRMLLGAAVLTLVFITACPNPTGLSFSIFTVTYRGNGHTAGSIPSGPERHRAGIDVTVKGNINNLYKYGYTFLGWTREGDNRPLLEEGDIFQISANTVLTAHWRQNSHNLSLRTDVYVTDDTHLFNNAVFNYGAQTAQTITVRNTGNMDSGTLTITLSNSVSFTVDPVSLGNLAPDETATFTITPNIGLDAGSYTSTVTVAGDTAVAWFNVSFTVDRALVEVAAITVAHPVAGASPNTTATINTGDNFSAGAVSWRLTSDDSGVTKFSNFGEYTAEVTLTITNSNFTFTGGLATATINGLPVSASFGSDGTTAVLELDLAEAHTYLLRFYSRDGLSSPFTYTLIAENTEFHLPTRSHGATPPTQYIVVRNAGNRASAPLNLAVIGINTNDTNFVPSATTIPNMPVDGESLLSITPAVGLGVGSYQAAVTISNSDIARNLGLRFSVYGLVYMIWVEGGDVELGRCLGGGPDVNPVAPPQFVPGFYMSRTPITRAEYREVRNWFLERYWLSDSSAEHLAQRGRFTNHFTPTTVNNTRPESERAVSQLNFHEAIRFANILSMKEGLEPVYLINGSFNPADWPLIPLQDGPTHENIGAWNAVIEVAERNGYRLPREAEWEFAAKGGVNMSPFQFSGSNDINAVGWHLGNRDGVAAQAVRHLQPNALGIYDMTGNVHEFIFHWATEPHPGSPTGQRAVRGGRHSDTGTTATFRVASRAGLQVSTSRGAYPGIRLVRQVPAAP